MNTSILSYDNAGDTDWSVPDSYNDRVTCLSDEIEGALKKDGTYTTKYATDHAGNHVTLTDEDVDTEVYEKDDSKELRLKMLRATPLELLNLHRKSIEIAIKRLSVYWAIEEAQAFEHDKAA